MKSIFISGLCIICAMLLIPISVMGENSDVLKTEAKNETVEKIPAKVENIASFKVLDTATNIITELSAEDYIFGVVAAEMPALYENEALKAQAVAAYTFACHRKAEAEKQGKDYHLTTDSETDQCYISSAAAREKWGEKADEYEQKIKSAVAEVRGKVLTYKNEIILSAYHAISSGVTESSENVWGNALPYLIPVESLGDKLAETYLSVISFSAEDITSRLSSLAEPTAEGFAFTEPQVSSSGTVLSIKINGKTVTGFAVSKALELRSACFEVSFADGIYTFLVKGYGHGVGMSQNGANYMAKQGSSYGEILTHYYPGCEIRDTI
ncbi:MAG: stage II sporulation protein D [Clostridia bacterium]|nr:stage II sporulation protein D [Clostridia bacterium]